MDRQHIKNVWGFHAEYGSTDLDLSLGLALGLSLG
jgi:hypothetical protein